MSLNKKKAEQRRTKADEIISRMQESRNQEETSTSRTVSALSQITSEPQPPEKEAAAPEKKKPEVPYAAVSSSNSSAMQLSADREAPFGRDASGKPIAPFGYTREGRPAKSSAGRKRKKSGERKVQLLLTISPETMETLQTWAKIRPRSAGVYLSNYVDEHVDEIMKYYNDKKI